MKPGLYVLAPLGIAADEPLTSAMSLVEDVMLVPFEDAWRDEARSFLTTAQEERNFVTSNELASLDKGKYCLARWFAPPGGGRPIAPAIYGGDHETRRVRGRYELAREWLRSFACLLVAGSPWFACSDWWFGLQVPGPRSVNATYSGIWEAQRVGWHGHVVDGQERTRADASYWSRLIGIGAALRRWPESRLALAAEAFARATFSNGETSELLWFWIALECIFAPSGGGEVSHRLCEGAAAFLEQDGGARLQAYTRLKRAYDLRSKLVHGDPRFPVERAGDTITELEDVVRRSLQKALLNDEAVCSFATPDKHRDYLLSLVLGPAQ